MANCPHCKKHLSFYHIKAECPFCGVNIPNYDWENMLDADAKKAEEAWKSFRIFTTNFKSALFGNKFRILRFACTFVPLIVLILPIATYFFNLPFMHNESTKVTLLDFTLNKLLAIDWGSILNLVKLDYIGTSFAFIFISLLLLYLAVVFGVLNFVFIIAFASKLKAIPNCICCAISALCFIASPILYSIATSNISNSGIDIFGGSIQFGIFIGILLFTLNFALNLITDKSFKKERTK